METQHKEQAIKLLELMNKANYFEKLKPEHNVDHSFNVTLKVSGYNELNLMVSDLLKASIVLLNKDARSLSSFTADSDINIMTFLEIALQLLPAAEMELFDDIHQLYLKSNIM
ncbi:hypothetical protein IRZ71_08270 [Flavobacterium sp. ANB]|uniref:hypothetical protein n=1 Tax=unclassified Flavobacterium TaxID=196869 RepID=UPI0012B9E26E|nr:MULTISPECIES: hypothetical protein [unclassified Flavobacterium]MBF4516334.1 hypothetical protein [Flavobacterium sp. ANB]MTD69769.1 hypothetical protein [Flavobacterium sp. LC2016-13]